MALYCIHRPSRPAVIGFLIPFAVAVVIGVLLHLNGQQAPSPESTGNTRGTQISPSTASGPQERTAPPSAEEVSQANAAILTYCRNDLRQGTNCTLIANTDKTAPRFVLSGVRMSGYFLGSYIVTDGWGLAQQSGGSWNVIWIGQGCIPKNVAGEHKVASSLGVCS